MRTQCVASLQGCKDSLLFAIWFYEEDIFSQLGKINGKQGKIFFSNWEKTPLSGGVLKGVVRILVLYDYFIISWKVSACTLGEIVAR